MKKNITTYIFSGIWVIFLVFFIIMARQSFQSTNIQLPQYQYNVSKDGRLHLGWDNIESEVEKIAESHNTAVMKLEESIRSEAKTMLLINFVSAFICFLGFIAQIVDSITKTKRNNHQPTAQAERRQTCRAAILQTDRQ